MSTRHPHGRFVFPLAIVIFLVTPVMSSAVTDLDISQQASAKLESGDLAAAASTYTQLLKSFPDSPKAPDAQLKLAYIKMKLSPKATQEVLDALAQVQTKYPSSPEAAEAKARIGFLHTRTDADQAIRDFTEFLSAHPSHPLAASVQQSLGRLYLKTNDLGKAEEAFDRAAHALKVSASLHDEAALQSGFVKIMKYYASKDKSHLPGAITALSALKTSSVLNVRARADLGIAECKLLLGKYSESHGDYASATQTYRSKPYFQGIALYGAAICSEETGQMEQAANEYATFLNGLAGTAIGEKDATWRRMALSSTSARVQVSVQDNGNWTSLPGLNLVIRSAFKRAKCLSMLRHHKEAVPILSELIAYLPEGDELRSETASLLARCQKAKGGN